MLSIWLVFLVCITLLLFFANEVVAQITTARKWACSDGAGKSIARPTLAYDPNVYLMSWDVSKQPDTGCVAIAFDGTNTDTTTSSIGLTAKSGGGFGITLLFDASSNVISYLVGDFYGNRILRIDSKSVNNPVTFAYGDGSSRVGYLELESAAASTIPGVVARIATRRNTTSTTAAARRSSRGTEDRRRLRDRCLSNPLVTTLMARFRRLAA
jgi:hypothetical protein